MALLAALFAAAVLVIVLRVFAVTADDFYTRRCEQLVALKRERLALSPATIATLVSPWSVL